MRPSRSCGDSMCYLCIFLIAATPGLAEVAGTVEGRVINTRSEGPVSGAVVELHGLPSTAVTDNYRTESDADGRFRIAGIVPGRYECLAQLTGFRAQGTAPRLSIDTEHLQQNVT